MVNLLDGARDHTTLRELVRQSKHRERLARTSLTVAHDGAVIAGNHVRDNLRRRQVIHIVLRGILQNFFKFKLPVVQLVVDDSLVCLVYLDLKFLQRRHVSIDRLPQETV